MDPGWPGIEHDLKNLATIPIQTRRAWLKEKRDTGKFDNFFPTGNAKPRCSFSQVKKKTKATKASSSSSKAPAESLKITTFFPSRRDMSQCFLLVSLLRGVACEATMVFPMQALLSHWFVSKEELP